jgi:FkbM family methyltransferase
VRSSQTLFALSLWFFQYSRNAKCVMGKIGKRLILSSAEFAARVLPVPVKQALYRWPAISGVIRRGLNRAVDPGMKEVTVAAGGLAGMRLSLDLQTEKDYWLGTYEPALQAAIRDWVRTGMVAYDIGANIGYLTLLLARQVGAEGRVYAFEALPANLERLAGNLALNSLEEKVSVVNAAVADRSAPTQFLVGPSGGMGKAAGSAGRREIAYTDTITVSGIALDDFVYNDGNPAPQVVKMDIEGGEVLALPGMKRLLSVARPLVFLELHGPESAQVAWERLTGAGYQICRMQPGYPRVTTVEGLGWKAYVVAKKENR